MAKHRTDFSSRLSHQTLSNGEATVLVELIYLIKALKDFKYTYKLTNMFQIQIRNTNSTDKNNLNIRLKKSLQNLAVSVNTR